MTPKLIKTIFILSFFLLSYSYILSDVTLAEQPNENQTYYANDYYVDENSTTEIFYPDTNNATDVGNNRTGLEENITKSFSKIKYTKSIDGLDEFNMRIDFTECIPWNLLNITITNYIIDWGDGNIIIGNGTPMFDYLYTYKEAGEYPISIQFIDNNGVTYGYLKNQSFTLTTGKFVQLWVDENKAPVVVGFGIIALLGLAFTEIGKYKILSFLFFVPMYARIQKTELLEQSVRRKVYDFIQENPGINYNQIIRELEMKNGTLSYHLHMLERLDMIKSRKEGIKRAFYPLNMKLPDMLK